MNRKHFCKRRLSKAKSAVSEVLGTILVLSITVVLFTAIFATVSTLEAPDRTTHLNMEARLGLDYHLVVEHKGGNPIETTGARIHIIAFDDETRTHRYSFDDVEVTLIGPDQDYFDIGDSLQIDATDLPQYLGYGEEGDEPEDRWNELRTSVDRLEMIISTPEERIWSGDVIISDVIGTRPYVRRAGVNYPREWEVFVEAGGKASLYANVRRPEGSVDDLEVIVDLSRLDGFDEDGISGSGWYNMEHDGGGRFVYPDSGRFTVPSSQENGTYALPLYVHTGNETHTEEFVEYGHKNETVAWSSPEYISINIGPMGDLWESPNIIVNGHNIEFIPQNPRNRDRLTARAVIENAGGSPARMNVSVYDRQPNVDYGEDQPYGEEVAMIEGVRVAAGGSTTVSSSWIIEMGGTHNITVRAWNITSTGGDDPTPETNIGHTDLFVQPSILLVDDTHEPGGDARRMKSAMQSLDLYYETFTVTGNDGPEFGEGDKPLRNYDVVIWMTGRTRGDGEGIEGRTTLSDNDRKNLTRYLETGKHLWLIGEGIAEDADTNVWTDWLINNLGSVVDSTNAGAPVSDYVNGVGTPFNDTDSFSVRDVSYDGAHISPTPLAESALQDGDDYVGVSMVNGHGSRTLFNSFLFDSISGGRVIMAARALHWLGNITHRYGDDIAITEQDISTYTPMYQETVEVEGRFRNNGLVSHNVEVALSVNGDIVERTTVFLEGDGGTNETTFEWTAEPVGQHDLLILVDPYDRIAETNYGNNDIRYQEEDYTVNVRFSVLLVDYDLDGQSADHIRESLDRLGYAYDDPDFDQNDRPDREIMQNYNSIYWITGTSTDGAVRNDDLGEIREYLEEITQSSFYLQGDNILEHITSLTDGSEFIDDILGIDATSIHNTTMPSEIRGVRNDPLSHGLMYRLDGDGTVTHVETLDATSIIRCSEGHTYGTRYHNEDDQYQTVFMGADLSRFDGPVYEDEWYDDFDGDIDTSPEAARQEFVYMITDWFGNVDERTELRVSSVDLILENPRPMLGRSYLLTATIQNIGHRPSNALIRFKDGHSLIASESIYVDGGGISSAEVTWQPLYAGPERPIRVLVDPLCNVEEIGETDEATGEHIDHMGFNNHAMIRNPVYYFWDDMENGTRNWDTQATIANINAESPLDFLSEEYENVYTDIADKWDSEMSHNVTVTDEFSYSDPYSYQLAEPVATNETFRLPLDMGLMIDTTGSMSATAPDGRTWMEHAIEATQDMIDLFDERDRVALFNLDHHHKDAGSFLWEDFRYMTDENKEFFKSRVGEFTADGGTPLWDASGYTINHILNNPRDEGTPGEDYVQSVMLFTDGDDEHFTGGWYERGSDTYAPGCVRGIGPLDHTWGVDGGHRWEEGIHDYIDQGPSQYDDVIRYGEQGSTTADWIRLIWRRTGNRTTERHALVDAPLLTFTVGLGITPQSTRPDAPGYMPPDDPDFPFTSEYQLIQIAESTEGSYFYAPDADELGEIFEEVFEQAAQEADAGNVTSMPGGPTPMGEEGLNSEPGLTQTTETRYMKLTTWGVNDLNTYRLEPGDPGTNYDSVTESRTSTATEHDCHWGVRVWRRDETGNEEEITGGTPVAQVSRTTDGQGPQSETWTPPNTPLSPTDSIVIRVYTSLGDGWREGETYTTEQLGASSLEDSQWTVHYYTDRSTSGWSQITTSATYWWGDQDSRIEGFTYTPDVPGPLPPTNPIPNDGASGVATDVELSVYVEHDDGDPMDVSFYDGSGGLIGTDNNVASGTRASVTWSGLDYDTTYSWYAVANDGSLTATSATWSFTTHAEDEDPVDPDPGPITGQNENKTAVTPSFDLTGYEDARLTFRNKYRMVSGTNGGFIQIGYIDPDNDNQDEFGYSWKYVIPSEGTYTGNMDMDVERVDDYGNSMNWAWNGVSGGGSFGWDHVRVNILRYVPEEHREDVRIKFNYTQYGGGTGFGWYLDDVRVVVSRGSNEEINDNTRDMWQQVPTTGRDGHDTTAWWIGCETDGFRGGLDNSLITNPIDLTNARTVEMSAHLKFNINRSSGAPPDGFRVEITTDNGRTWMPLNLGVRTAWGVSGTGGEDSYEGADVGNGWTTAESLRRLETDLSDFRGEVVRIRFRMYTTTASAYQHYDDVGEDYGFFVDDFIVSGRSLVEG